MRAPLWPATTNVGLRSLPVVHRRDVLHDRLHGISHASQMAAIWFRVLEEGDQVRHADNGESGSRFSSWQLYLKRTLLSEKHVLFEWAQLRSTISFNLELARKGLG